MFKRGSNGDLHINMNTTAVEQEKLPLLNLISLTP